MDTTQILYAIAIITAALFGVIWTMILGRIRVTELAVINHDRRLQKVEDVFTLTIENLTKKVEQLSQKVDDLAREVHKEKNTETALNSTLLGLLRHMETSDEQHGEMIKCLQKLNNHYEKSL